MVKAFPHDPTAFTQGLVFADGIFYESTGLRGYSTLRKVTPETGAVIQQVPVESRYFAEGLALVGVCNSHHFGAAAYHLEPVARAGLTNLRNMSKTQGASRNIRAMGSVMNSTSKPRF